MAKVTIDKLAIMVKKGFDKVSTKEEIKDLKDNFEGRFNKIDNHLKVIDGKLNNIVYRNEFEKLENKVKEIENILNSAGIKV
jgi:hypothetical protein